MSRSHVAVLALALCAACGSPVPPPLAKQRPQPPAPLIVPDIAAEAPAAVKDLGAVSAPPRPLCALDPEAWTSSVSLRRDGPPFATIESISATVSLAADDEGRWAVANVETKTATVRGITAAPPLFLKKPTSLGGYVIPSPATSFSWDEARGASDALTISFDLTAFFVAPALLKEQIPCADLGLTPRRYDPRSLLGGENLESAGVVGGGVDLRLSPTATPIAKTAAGAQLGVFVLKSGKSFSRVLLDMRTGYAFGWIESRYIDPRARMGRGVSIIRPRVAYTNAHSNQCARDLQLIAEFGGERAVVGSLKAGAAFKPGAADETSKLTAVDPQLQWLRLEKGATLWVPTSELAACGSSAGTTRGSAP